MIEITQEFLQEILHYDYDTGLFTWKFRRPETYNNPNKEEAHKNKNIGKIADKNNEYGVYVIHINNKTYVSHNLVWMYVYGTWPNGIIKHINGNKKDNRFINLQILSPEEKIKKQKNKAKKHHEKEISNRDSILSKEYLQEKFLYDHETGIFERKLKNGKTKKVGCNGTGGYITISLNGKMYLAHRLAWVYIYDKVPTDCIDHINGIVSDNRICNLREATIGENLQNIKSIKKNKKSNYMLGVSQYKHDKSKFTSSISINGNFIYLGISDTEEEAHNKYLAAKKELHPFSTI